jgi:hypothetical protein
MKKEIDDERYRHFRLYAVGFGANAKAAPLGRIGRDGHQLVAGEASLGGAFEQLAGRIEGQRQRMYLLSYCTPARGGEHAVRIEARTRGEQPRAGSARTKFVADGFGTPPECDPHARPRFAGNVRVQPQTLPAPDAAAAAGEQQSDSTKPAAGDGAGAKPQRPRGAAKRDPNVIDWKPSETR